MFELTGSWQRLLKSELQKEYFQALIAFLQEEYNTKSVYPPEEMVFRTLELTPYEKVKVVILGQDPYHQKGQGCGLSFSVNKGVKIPPSLENIYKELYADLKIPPASHGDLTHWAKQGVLLLNTVMTVVDSRPNSHKNKGWERFTDRIITLLNLKNDPVIFLLWGKNAQAKINLLTSKKHLILQSSHPSPYSANYGFFGSRPFGKVNTFLSEFTTPIDWQLPE